MSDNDTMRQTSGSAGRQAEDLATRFLEKKKFRIIARNYRCRGGEIDLICRNGRTLVFVEVRLRRNSAFGGAAESITNSKQRRIILAAQHYLAANVKTECACRFDCILLDGRTEDHIEWIRDAFTAD